MLTAALLSLKPSIPHSTSLPPQQADEKVMAFAEPLAVAIHAAHEAGDLQGKRVFISGVGPIGCLIVSAVKTLGAAEVACADISARALSGPADGR
ncbi:L-idonate 5-dehydrogenase [Salmonella enterica subsp. arizonae]|nr:L-idonate 5-dehydrogenase [Salmonella enterica subsp. arizonae]